MTNGITLVLPTKSELTHDDQAIFTDVRDLVVRDKETSALGQVLLRRLATGKKFIVEKIKPIKEPAHETWQAACSLEREQIAPYDAATKSINRKLDDYDRAEQQRAIAEANRKADEQRKQEEERRRQELELARKQGATKAELKQIKAEPLPPVTVTPEPEIAKVGGVNKVGRWTGSVKDIRKFVRWLAKQPDNEGWFSKIQIGQEDLNAAARMHELALPDRIPGLFAEKVTNRSVRAE